MTQMRPGDKNVKPVSDSFDPIAAQRKALFKPHWERRLHMLALSD